MTKLYDEYQTVSTKPYKLKDSPHNRRFVIVELENTFGSIPEMIAIEKVFGKNNEFTVKAFVKKGVLKPRGFEVKDIKKKK